MFLLIRGASILPLADFRPQTIGRLPIIDLLKVSLFISEVNEWSNELDKCYCVILSLVSTRTTRFTCFCRCFPNNFYFLLWLTIWPMLIVKRPILIIGHWANYRPIPIITQLSVHLYCWQHWQVSKSSGLMQICEGVWKEICNLYFSTVTSRSILRGHGVTFVPVLLQWDFNL